jgi:hypothetical protein
MAELGCQYKSDSDAICVHLSQIVIDRDNRMLEQFGKQNEIINDHNTKVIDLLTDLQTGITEQKTTFEKEIGDMQSDITWLKQRSSKKTVRKRIALTVIIAVVLTIAYITMLMIFGKI